MSFVGFGVCVPSSLWPPFWRRVNEMLFGKDSDTRKFRPKGSRNFVIKILKDDLVLICRVFIRVLIILQIHLLFRNRYFYLVSRYLKNDSILIHQTLLKAKGFIYS